jgi:hypothetical protein
MDQMKTIYFMLAVAAAMVLGGCQTGGDVRPTDGQAQGIQIQPRLATRTADGILASGESVELPGNYSPDNYRMLTVAVSFFAEDRTNPGVFSVDQTPTVASLLETELTKLRRFTILSRSQLGQQAIGAEVRFQDTGMVDVNDMIRFGRQRGADFAFAAGVTLAREIFDRVRDQEVIYTVLVNYQLINIESGEIVEADTAEGRARRTFFQMPSGNIVGGFNPNDRTQVTVALNEASINALKVIANKLGNTLPVGGRVIGFRGDAFQVDAGRNQGLMGEQVVVLYTTDMGVDVPLARGRVSPGVDTTRGTIFQWSRDPSVQNLVTQLQTDARGFMLDYDLWAVSDGIPLPPEWDNVYAN